MIPGQVAISPRALSRIVQAIAADELRVAANEVVVELSDDQGLLAVSISSPLQLPRLGTPGSVGGLQRCQSARNAIETRTTEITGGTIRTVTIRVTRARVLQESRMS